LFKQEDTKSIFIIEEIGGSAATDAAHIIRGYNATMANAKLAIAIVAIQIAPTDKTMGHAGTLLAPGDDSAEAKSQIFAVAGATVMAYLCLAGSSMTELLKQRSGLA
jgi:succinyl-CoA synthetase alpha subunit